MFNLVRASLFQAMVVCLSIILVSACGGGGDSSPADNSSATPAPVSATTAPAAPPPTSQESTDDENYTPDTAALDSEANKSTQLYVEPDFTFDTHKVITLDITATGANGQALANTMVLVSVVDNDIEAMDDEKLQNKALLTVAKTNSNGTIYRKVEIASIQKKLLIELNALGIENEVLVAIAEDNYVTHQFR
ncbi:hypothetical protein HHX48_15190 [Salinimonas sp. HHU 13199]|uniref:Lipoprotein n=1 Tax=Salinimonas profundi TaxID=2729140 RepID=A0ABR8LSK4_9ALTE|nr:hypothetical protein [Salinimonas profundi]MBD3587089.1 hypothetical protein [Salinimonas profundi]